MHFFDKKVCPDFIYITAFFASEKVQKTRKKRAFYPKKTSKKGCFWPFLDQNDKIEKQKINLRNKETKVIPPPIVLGPGWGP